MAMPMNMTYGQVVRMLQLISQYTAYTLLPTTCFLISLGVIGFVGNTISIYIFIAKMKRNLQNDLFAFLTSIGIVVCVVSIPRELTDVFFGYIYPDVILCKVGRFVNTCGAIGQVVTLIALAIVRYMAVCVGKPIQVHSGYFISGLLSLTFSLSWLAPIVFGFSTEQTFVPGIKGRDCSVADESEPTLCPFMYNMVMAVGFSILIVVTGFCYIRIWIVVNTNNKTMAAHHHQDDTATEKQTKNKDSSHNKYAPKSTTNSSEETPTNGEGVLAISMTEKGGKNDSNSTQNNNADAGGGGKKGGGKIDKRKSVENAISFTAFLLTFSFIIAYVPFLLVALPRMWNPKVEDTDDVVLQNLMKIAVRFYFTSSVSNPIIYLVSNLEFKRQVKAVFGCSSKSNK